MLTVSTQLARLLVRGAERKGVDTQALLDASQVPRALLDDVDGRLPESPARLLLFQLLQAVDDPCWGLALSEDLPPGSFGTLGYVFRNSETLADSYARTARYARLINEAAQPRFERGAHGGTFTVHTADATPLPPIAVRFRAQLWMSVLVRVGRKIAGVEFQPEQVAFPFPRPESVAPYRAIFDCKLVFDAPHPQLVLSADVLSLPVRNPDRSLAALMERYARGLMERLPDTNDIGLRVRQATCRALQDGDARLERVARELGLSTRSLQRRLHASDISFTVVLDEVRRELALAYLQEAELSVDQVASVLGFATGSSFAKAFRRWTGAAPARYRATQTSLL